MKVYKVIGVSGLGTQLEGTYFKSYYNNYDRAVRMYKKVKLDVKDPFLDEEYPDGDMMCRNGIWGVSLDIIEVIEGE